jgi:hypothetical protein
MRPRMQRVRRRHVAGAGKHMRSARRSCRTAPRRARRCRPRVASRACTPTHPRVRGGAVGSYARASWESCSRGATAAARPFRLKLTHAQPAAAGRRSMRNSVVQRIDAAAAAVQLRRTRRGPVRRTAAAARSPSEPRGAPAHGAAAARCRAGRRRSWLRMRTCCTGAGGGARGVRAGGRR